MDLKGKSAITGWSELKPMKEAGEHRTLDLLAQSAYLAIKDAGLQKKDIDGLLVTPPGEDTCFMWPSQVAEYLQLTPDFMNMVELGGASAVGAVARAAMAVAAGLCRHCLCLSGGIWDSQVFNTREGKVAVMSQAEIEFELPFGPMGFNSGYAMITRRHMHCYGTTPEQLARIAVQQRFNALANPDALYNQKPLTTAEVLSSPLIVDPIHLLEIVRPCSGAAAVIVSRTDQALDRPRLPVYVLGFGEGYTHNSIVCSPDLLVSPVKIAASKAFSMAGVARADIDFISVYDCYPITVLMTIEDAGFCSKGEGGDFIDSMDLTYRGSFPCNTHGGQLSCGQASYAGGMSHIIEAVRQIQGRAGQRQLKKNRVAFVNGNGGVMSTEASLILGREHYGS